MSESKNGITELLMDSIQLRAERDMYKAKAAALEDLVENLRAQIKLSAEFIASFKAVVDKVKLPKAETDE